MLSLRPILAAAVIALGFATAAHASCMAPTRETACPTCALMVIGAYREADGPHIDIERIVALRTPGVRVGSTVTVTAPWRSAPDAAGHVMYEECAFVPADGQRMLYYLNPDPAAPGHWLMAWGFPA